MDFFFGHPDYLHFLNGAFLALSAAVAISFQRRRMFGQAWKAHILFGVSGAVAHWLYVVQSVIEPNLTVSLTQSFFFAVSYLSLAGFALSDSRSGVSYRSVRWFLLLPAGVALLIGGYGVEGLPVFLHYAVAPLCTLAAALACMRRAQGISWPKRAAFRAHAVMFPVYGFLACAALPESPFFPANYLNDRVFVSMTGSSALHFQPLVTGLIVLSMWLLYPVFHPAAAKAVWIFRYVHNKWLTTGTIIGTLLGGWLMSGAAGWLAAADYERLMTGRLRFALAAMGGNVHAQLARVSEGRRRADSGGLCEVMEGLLHSQDDLLAVFLAREVNGGWCYVCRASKRPGHDREAEIQEGNPIVNAYLLEGLRAVASGAESSVSQPLERLGMREHYLIALAPFHHPETGEVAAVFGMDVHSADWYRNQSRHRLPVMLVVLLVISLLVALFSLQRRDAEMNVVLGESRQMLADVIDFLPDPTFALDAERRIVIWNRAMESMTGVPAAEMIGKGNYEYSIPFLGGRRPQLVDLLFEHNPKTEAEYLRWDPDGDGFSGEIHVPAFGPEGAWLWMIAKPRLDEKGARVGAIESIRDISAQHRDRAALLFEEARLEAQIRIYEQETKSADDILHFALEEAVRLTQSEVGYIAFLTEDETVLNLYAWSEAVMRQCRVENITTCYPMAGVGLWGEPVRQRRAIITNDYDAPCPWKKGMPEGHIPVFRHLGVPVMEGERIVLITGVGNKRAEYTESDARQVTLFMSATWNMLQRKRAEADRRRLQEELLHAQKMEAIGRLAGGIAHDFNNLLVPLLACADMMRRDLPIEHPHRDYVEQMIQAGLQAKALITQLLALGKQQPLELKTHNIGKILVNMEGMLRRAIRADIRMNVRASQDVFVRCDRGQIEQVIMNLALNAQDAMARGGILDLETAVQRVEDSLAREVETCPPGWYAVLSVKDTGTGMDAETVERMFEPFFTTKNVGAGYGLGLSMVYGIVKQHGGHIDVHSEPGCGTIVQILFSPAEDAEPEPEASVEPPPAARGGENVLLVEDNEMVRGVTSRILSRQGFRVTAVATPGECLQLIENDGGGYDLLLTDVVLPEMNGVELYERLAADYPGMKVLFMSGYADNLLNPGGGPYTQHNFIAKPFTVHSLSRKVRDVLDA